MSDSSPILSSRISRTRSRSSLAFVALILLISRASLFAQTAVLTPLVSHDQKVVKRWTLDEDPHGVAIGPDGTIYLGLAKSQAVIAVDPKSGAIRKRVVLDSADIAATKELVTLRIDATGTRLYIANGSDESATILSLPDLGVIREITMEGEAIRDALPDPKGRFLYLLGRRVHVFDADGATELHTIPMEDPMAVAASSSGATIAVVGSQLFGKNKATAVALYGTDTFAELTSDPLQTDKTIESAMFAAGDKALIALGREWLYEKPLVTHAAKTMTPDAGAMRMSIDFGDLVNSQRICLPDGSGPQIAALASPLLLLFAEKRCSSSGAFNGSSRAVTPASLYGVNAYSLAYDRSSNTLVVTDRAGTLTIYRVPRAPVVH